MDQNELFKNYLEGKLSQEDKIILEKLLAENPSHKAEWEKFKKKQLPTKRGRFKSWAISFLIALGIVALGISLIYSLATPPGPKLFSAYYEPFDLSTLKISEEHKEFEKGMEAFRTENYEEALQIFEKMEAKNADAEVLFFLGLCHLALDRPEKAVPILDRIPEESQLFKSSAWYMALGYLKLSKLQEAKTHLSIASEDNSEISDQAKEILAKIK